MGSLALRLQAMKERRFMRGADDPGLAVLYLQTRLLIAMRIPSKSDSVRQRIPILS